MNNKTFEVLKWFALVIIPALATFVGLVGKALNWQYTDICVVIITGFGTIKQLLKRTIKHMLNWLEIQQ
ncbi:TPA: phage holin [Enterococcus faecium]